ncbi:891_t:CDS:1, partial [Gigaspora rosea]
MSDSLDFVQLSDHETSQTIEPMQSSLKTQTSLDSYLFYEGITASEGSSPEESNEDIIYEHNETSAKVYSPFTAPRSSQIPAKRKSK